MNEEDRWSFQEIQSTVEMTSNEAMEQGSSRVQKNSSPFYRCFCFIVATFRDQPNRRLGHEQLDQKDRHNGVDGAAPGYYPPVYVSTFQVRQYHTERSQSWAEGYHGTPKLRPRNLGDVNDGGRSGQRGGEASQQATAQKHREAVGQGDEDPTSDARDCAHLKGFQSSKSLHQKASEKRAHRYAYYHHASWNR